MLDPPAVKANPWFPSGRESCYHREARPEASVWTAEYGVRTSTADPATFMDCFHKNNCTDVLSLFILSASKNRRRSAPARTLQINAAPEEGGPFGRM